MAFSGGDEFDVICIEEADIDVDDKQYRSYDRALGAPLVASAIWDRVL